MHEIQKRLIRFDWYLWAIYDMGLRYGWEIIGMYLRLQYAWEIPKICLIYIPNICLVYIPDIFLVDTPNICLILAYNIFGI